MSQQSVQHRDKIIQLGILWGHFNDGYGQCIKQYTKLLVNKISFHDRNPKIHNNLVMEKTQLELVFGNDINIWWVGYISNRLRPNITFKYYCFSQFRVGIGDVWLFGWYIGTSKHWWVNNLIWFIFGFQLYSIHRYLGFFSREKKNDKNLVEFD